MIKLPHIKIKAFSVLNASKEKERIFWVPNIIGQRRIF